MENYDSVEHLTKDGEQVYSSEFNDNENNLAPQIQFIKKIDGTYYVVEAACENNYNKLWVQSAYLTKNKEDVTQAAFADNTDQDTNARSALASPSSNTDITQKEIGVNNIISAEAQNNTKADRKGSADFMPDDSQFIFEEKEILLKRRAELIITQACRQQTISLTKV